MKYLSVCSGIEAATVAWHPIGWTPIAFAETDRFPSAVLAQHYPAVPNRGDMTAFAEWPDAALDVLVGGTPCQSFSVAGLRAGLGDPRGSLMLTYLALAGRYRPRWLVWENVPGVLSSDDGRAFGTLLGGLAICGYGFAYRILDAQYFGLAQRRRRVFVIGCLGDWRRAAAVLFERASLSGHPAPRRETGENPAGTIGGSSQSGGFRTTDLDNSGAFIPEIVPQAMSAKWSKGTSGPAGDEVANLIAGTLGAEMGRNRGIGNENEVSMLAHVAHSVRVRRLTPRECERLQGFPDDYTLIPYRGKPAADGPRYKALGNSMAVPVMRWIGERIALVDSL